MKPKIHPKYAATVFQCACGSKHETFSTLGGVQHVDICSQCHPFFKGKVQKLIDTAGRIEKFNRRYKRA